jgi:hypothetical protein
MDTWRKSTYSSGDGGQCLETASDGGAVMVRDTVDRDGVVLMVSPKAWQSFVDRLRG